MDTYAHTQDKPRLELTEKIEANFYSQDLPRQHPSPGKMKSRRQQKSPARRSLKPSG